MLIRVAISNGEEPAAVKDFWQHQVRIGRDNCNDIVLDDPRVSATHGELRLRREGLVYEDLRSTNGSKVRRSAKVLPIDARCFYTRLLRAGDELLLGDSAQTQVLQPNVLVGENIIGLERPEAEIAVAASVAGTETEVLATLPAGFDRAALLALHRHATQATQFRDVSSVLAHFASCILELFETANHVAIFLRSPEGDDFLPFFARDRRGTVDRERISRTLQNIVTEGGRAIIFHAGDAKINNADSLRLSDVRAGMCAPLWNGESIVGLAQVDRRGSLADVFSPADLEVFTVFAHQLALSVDNASLNERQKVAVRRLERANSRMEKLAFVDPLTGLSNRRLLMDRLNQAVAVTKRTRRAFALLYIDLDLFKEVNDTLGHDFGDELLKEVANRIRSVVRDQDTVARVGGDEFVILLAEVSGADGAVTVAHKIQESLNETFQFRHREVSISASVGISIAPDHALDAPTLLKCADRAMYRSKSGGRKAVNVFSGETLVM
ncbi:MAG: diguanylate cyclase [Gammaproteobacteria bacterium]|nr:diguanylate cyclase [Gammaproteobacteria bacterium]